MSSDSKSGGAIYAFIYYIQLIICAFARGRRCARLIICYGRRYLERTCMECGNGGWLEETMQQMRRAVIKKALSIVRKLKEDSESTR